MTICGERSLSFMLFMEERVRERRYLFKSPPAVIAI
jgi:hypothetical protein